MTTDLKRSPIEYKVLGKGTVTAKGQQLSLVEQLNLGNATGIESILNALGKDGWEVVTLSFPCIFKRSISRMEVEIGELVSQLASRE
jgi:hypothetical protein